MNKYKLIACGGTFDLFHAGHKAFLQEVLSHSEKVLLGITSDLYIKSFKNGKNIESFEFRKKTVEDFLISIGAKNRVQISPINNFYGPLLLMISTFRQLLLRRKQSEWQKKLIKKENKITCPN
jgi:pantetheine-phosphate adenylyltransferase